MLPRLEINLPDITRNTKKLVNLYGKKKLSLMGVSKGVLGSPSIAQAMIDGGVHFIADSRIENIIRMKAQNLKSKFVLLRSIPSEAKQIIDYADISFNTEIETLRRLSLFAKRKSITHKVVLMVELGDLREGILPIDLMSFIREVLLLSNIKIIGLGCNLACHAGIVPDKKNMNEFSSIVEDIKKDLSIDLPLVSGGNSANYNWCVNSTKREMSCVNNIRLGESILLGRNPVDRSAIPGLSTDAFKLFVEVIESKRKPSLPQGSFGQNAYGEHSSFTNIGDHQRAIVAIGRHDIGSTGVVCDVGSDVMGVSSDHLIINDLNNNLKVGESVTFNLSYSGMLYAMTSPYVKKTFLYEDNWQNGGRSVC